MGENRERQQFCFVYANKLKAERDAFERIVKGYGDVRREYVVNSPSVMAEDVTRENVQYRLEEIQKTVKPNEELRVILAGFSPLVALVHEIAKDMGLRECYFFKDDRTQEYIEIPAF